MSALLMFSSPKFTDEIPRGIQWVALAPIGIGVSHVVVYLVGRNKA